MTSKKDCPMKSCMVLAPRPPTQLKQAILWGATPPRPTGLIPDTALGLKRYEYRSWWSKGWPPKNKNVFFWTLSKLGGGGRPLSKLIMHLFISCIFGLLLHKCFCFELWTAFEVEYLYSTTPWVEYLYFNTPFKTPISVLITVYRGGERGKKRKKNWIEFSYWTKRDLLEVQMSNENNANTFKLRARLK